MATHLAGSRAGSLTQHLFSSFSKGGESRRAFDLHEFIEEVEHLGTALYAPMETNLGSVRQEVVSTLFILQRCPAPFPVEVVAGAVECEIADLMRLLGPLEDDQILFRKDERLTMVPRSTQIAVAGYADLLARALRFLLDWIKVRGDCPGSREQVANVIGLAQLCATQRPESVVGVFGRLQSVLKAMGDKHVVLQVADLCLQVANRMDQNEDAAQARALTLICGVSWVYQRIGRLSEAMVSAEQSLELGRRIAWQRNTAYCMKCIGRLLRLLSEVASDESERKDLLHQSIEKLKEAIGLFEKSSEHGPTNPDTGDCYSLLGRTYLVSDQLVFGGSVRS